MCLLTFIPAGVEFDYARARKSAISNPDGFGFAIHAGVAIIKDHDMDFEKLWIRWTDLRKSYFNSVAMFHFRIATHGTLDVDNCHPFDVGNTLDVVLGHNGILPLAMPVHEVRSDSKLFAEIILPAMGGVCALDNRETFKNLEEWAFGSKLVILSADPKSLYDWYIINESDGYWDYGMWWSNKSYIYSYAPAYVDYGYGWKGDEHTSTIGKAYDDRHNDEPWNLGDEERMDDERTIRYIEMVDYLQDELYPSQGIMNTIESFTDFSSEHYATATCNGCGDSYMADPYEISATHCGECKSCMACGKPGCNCWDTYEYGQAFYTHLGELGQNEFTLDEKGQW